MLIVQHFTRLITKQFSVKISIPVCLMPFWQLHFFWFYTLMSNWHGNCYSN